MMLTGPDDDRDLQIDRRTLLRKGATAAGAVVVGTAAFSAPAAADQWDKRVDQTGLEVDNECTGETMTVTSGTALFDTDVREDESGGRHFTSKLVIQNLKLAGNDTGTTYTGSYTSSQSEYVGTDTAPVTFTSTGNLDFVSQGPAPNYRARIRTHVTFDANGDRTVDTDYRIVECQS